jgi:glycosyltransferase involved in cell wall biosynthesis
MESAIVAEGVTPGGSLRRVADASDSDFQAPPPGEPMRVMFVCQNDFGAPSEKQVLGFAQQLARAGHDVLISFHGDPASAESEGALAVDKVQVHCHGFSAGKLRRGDAEVARAFAPTLVHAWNSRVPTMAAARAYQRATDAPLFVHFEDDEWHVPPHPPGERWLRRLAHRGRRALCHIDPSLWWFSNHRSLREVSRHAVALDALTPTLAGEVRRRLDRECSVVLPVSPDLPAVGAAKPQIPDGFADHPLLVITGTIWPVYLPDFQIGFRAVAELQRRGHDVRLVHAGRVLPRFDPADMALQAGIRPDTAAFLGYVPFGAVPPLLRMADVLLQPGPPSDFNRLRLPSKLQGYLASGTPTVSFGVGFGELLEDRRDCLKTRTPDPMELADRIAEVLTDPELRTTLAAHGPRAAARLFDSRSNTEALLAHYRRALGLPANEVARGPTGQLTGSSAS